MNLALKIGKIDHPGSTAITLVTELLRDELTVCRGEGLWNIRLA